jgi:competence/damage-inducible protein CinA-like protein
LSRPRAVVLVTGSELVRGDRRDANGPFLAAELVRLGLEPARITIVGDAPEELRSALAEGLEADLLVISGGLGPTHDDRTIELLAATAGRELVVDADLEAEIETVSRRIAERLRRPYADFAAGVRKQASLPAGGTSLGLAGTAPGVVLPANETVAVALPGPPSELQRLWLLAVASEPVQAVLSRARPPGRRVLRFFGASESAVAQALADAGGDGDGVEATICARDFEIHVDFIVEPGGDERADELAAALREPLRRYLFAEDERPIAEIVLALCRARGMTLATAESCTGGMVAERVTSVPGASDVFAGSVVSYSNSSKHHLLRVPIELLERHGAVSAEVAAAMASGARMQLRSDVAVAVTGIAGPDGGTPDKPVGLVYLHGETPDAERGRELNLPGDRDQIRRRSTVAALHLLRTLLTQNRDEGV